MTSVDRAQIQLKLADMFLDSIKEFNEVTGNEPRMFYWNGYGQAITDVLKAISEEMD